MLVVKKGTILNREAERAIFTKILELKRECTDIEYFYLVILGYIKNLDRWGMCDNNDNFSVLLLKDAVEVWHRVDDKPDRLMVRVAPRKKR